MKKGWVASFKDLEVEVIFVPRTSKHLMFDDVECRGITEYDELKIYIADNLTDYTAFITLIHEFTHFALYAYDYSADDTQEQIKFRTEEELCRFNEKALPAIYEQARDIMRKRGEQK